MDAELSRSLNMPLDPILRHAGELRQDDVDLGGVFALHRRRLVNLAFAITLDSSAAEEVVQDAFLGLQRNASRVDNPVGYLQRSVVNLSVSIIRRRRFTHPRALMPEMQVEPSTPEIGEMWSRVMRLPAQQRAVIVLRFWEDLSLADISNVLGRPIGSIKSTLHRALSTLKEDLT